MHILFIAKSLQEVAYQLYIRKFPLIVTLGPSAPRSPFTLLPSHELERMLCGFGQLRRFLR